jgi:hypothetical protein
MEFKRNTQLNLYNIPQPTPNKNKCPPPTLSSTSHQPKPLGLIEYISGHLVQGLPLYTACVRDTTFY